MSRIRFLSAILSLALLISLSCAPTFSRAPSARDVDRYMQHAVGVRMVLIGIRLTEKKISFNRDDSSGSGIVISSSPKRSLVLTNEHICRAQEQFVAKDDEDATPYKVIGRAIGVRTLDGKVVKAKVERMDVAKDLCLLSIPMYAGHPVSIGKSLPERGGSIVYVGYPAGVYEADIAFVGDGRYLGTVKRKGNARKLFLSAPIHGGASGSGVYHRGKLVGLISSMDADFNHIAYAVTLSDVREFLSKELSK